METEDKIPCFIATAFPLKRWSQDGAVGVCTKPVILALEMLKQEDQKFKSSLSYIRLSFRKTRPNNHSTGQ